MKLGLIVCSLMACTVFGKVQISLLTTTPGDQPHTIFGHTAVRVLDADKEIDQVFNYGLVNFNQPFFPIKLLHGTTDYWLGVQTMEKFIELNNREKRIIQEQILDISVTKAAQIASDLVENAKSENKFYRYSFTQKNCATPVRDLLIKHGLFLQDGQSELTYRELLQEFTQVDGWYQFGINLILGTMAEEQMTTYELMFIPDRLRLAVQDVPGLVKANNELNDPEELKMGGLKAFLLSPLFIFSLIALLSIFYKGKWFKAPLFILIGALGSFLLYITVVTEHVELMNNFNLLWCNPLLLLLGFTLLFSNKTYWLSLSIFCCMILAVLMYVLNIQKFDLQIIPLLFAFFVLLGDEIKQHRKRVGLMHNNDALPA